MASRSSSSTYTAEPEYYDINALTDYNLARQNQMNDLIDEQEMTLREKRRRYSLQMYQYTKNQWEGSRADSERRTSESNGSSASLPLSAQPSDTPAQPLGDATPLQIPPTTVLDD